MSRRVEWVLFVLILLIAALFRMGWPGWTEFKADEARMLTAALEMAGSGRFAVRGLSSSVGFPNFPMSVWLYTLPLLVWRHVYAATIFTGFLNTLAVVACYWLVRRYWGVQAALVAILLFAVSPWAIIFSRKIWAQNLLPLFVMGWVIGAALAFAEKRPKFILLHLLCLAISVQIHLAAIALAPVTLLFLIVFRRRVEWRLAGIGSAISVITAIPFLYYLWQNQGQVEQLQTTGSKWQVSLESLRYTAMMTLGSDIHSLAGPEAFENYLGQIPWMGWVYGVWGGMVLLVIGYWLLEMRVGRFKIDTLHFPLPNLRQEVGFIVLVWLLAPSLFFLAHNTPVFLHYFIATLPVAYILVGGGVTAVSHHLESRGFTHLVSQVVISLLVVTAVFQLYAVWVLLGFLDKNSTPDGFGTPIGYWLETAETAEAMLAEAGATEILVVGSGESPHIEEFPAIYQALLHGIPHRFVDVNRTALFPLNSAVIIATEGEMTAMYRETAVRQEIIPLRVGESPLHILALPANHEPSPDHLVDPPALLANWVSFIGYDEPAWIENNEPSTATGQPLVVGAIAVWQLYWHTGGNPDPNQYQFFVHLLDAQGQRVSQTDVPAFSPGQWRGVDTAVTRFVLAWPETAVVLRVGMYQYPSLDPIYLLDVAGNPYSDALDIHLQNGESPP